jgi:hypothetical protein
MGESFFAKAIGPKFAIPRGTMDSDRNASLSERWWICC